MALTLAMLHSAVEAEAAKWEQKAPDEVLALIPSKERDYYYELDIAGSLVEFNLELLQVRDEAVDLMLQAQPVDEAGIDAVRVPRALGQKGGWSDDELGIASAYFWIDRK